MKCYYPKNNLVIDTDGYIRPCCYFSTRKYMDKNVQLPMFNFNNQKNISEYSTSNFLTSIKKLVNDNKLPKGGCNKCIDEENLNKGSSMMADSWNTFKYVDKDQTGFSELEIRFGNKCNLGCIMCDYSNSSLLESEMISNAEVFKSKGFNIPSLPDKSLQWFEDDNKIKQMAVFSKNARYIRFAGGEPTVNNYLRNFLSELKKYNTETELKITTNGFKIPSSLLDEIKHFKTVEFSFSIDGYQEVNEFVRWPSKWSAICKNIDTISEMKNCLVSVSSTLQLSNVFNFKKLSEWVLNNKNIELWDIANSVVYEPEYFYPSLANKKYKDELIEYIDKFDNPEKIKGRGSNIKTLIPHLNNIKENSKELLEQASKKLDVYATIRKLPWQKYIKI